MGQICYQGNQSVVSGESGISHKAATVQVSWQFAYKYFTDTESNLVWVAVI